MIGPARELGATVLLGWRAVAGLRSRAWPRGEIPRQALAAGNRSLLLVATTLAFLGMILSLQSGLQAQRILGDVSPVGPTFVRLMIREFGPIMTGLMVAARVGAGLAAEVGTMVVTEQVDALRMNAADPIRWIASPRTAAVFVVHGALTVYGTAFAIAAGSATAWRFFAITPAAFIDFADTGVGDVVTGVIKSAVFGAYIPVVAIRAGLAARGGSQGVGHATTRAVVAGSIGVIALDALLGALFQVLGF